MRQRRPRACPLPLQSHGNLALRGMTFGPPPWARGRAQYDMYRTLACHVWLWNCLRFPKTSLTQTPWRRYLRVRGSVCTSSACRVSLSRPAKVRGRARGHRRRVSRTRAAGGRVRRRCAFDVARKRRNPLALFQCHHIVIRRRIVKPFKTIHVLGQRANTAGAVSLTEYIVTP